MEMFVDRATPLLERALDQMNIGGQQHSSYGPTGEEADPIILRDLSQSYPPRH